jgi:hypothetical protein
MLVGEEALQVGLAKRGDDTALGGCADDRHGVALLLEPLELLGHARALGSLLAELLGDGAELGLDVLLELVVGHFEVVLGLQGEQHAAEVVADEVLEQGLGRVALVGDAMLVEDLVGELGAGLKGQVLRLAEGVVAVEQDVLGLCAG